MPVRRIVVTCREPGQSTTLILKHAVEIQEKQSSLLHPVNELFFASFQDISVSVSVLTLTFIAYDRYNAICRPLQFSTRKTKAAAVIAAIWTISSMIGKFPYY